uniref:RING-type E3 ubiquitin transferase n=1 Tax=Populus alba TaxID=43335 RepID=A0A4U5LSM2_POPAL|nr:hypothetical protein D5086_0000326080 [Populus alba]
MEGIEERKKKSEAHLTVSAAAFVEGGIQEACDDACSICLENFCDSDPSSVTSCKHEFHLQCILEWCQRSSQCPMCWQPISLKDPMRELLEAVEQRGVLVGANDAELEERLIQHLTAAAAMGGVREGEPVSAIAIATPSSQPLESTLQPITPLSSEALADPCSASASGSSFTNQHANSMDNRSPNQSSPNSQDRAGPSDLQSFSESIKSKFNAVSMRYKESISKSTRGWKERFFTRNTTMADLGSEVRREVNAGIATVSRMMEHLETRDDSRTGTSSVSNSVDGSVAESNSQQPEVGVVNASDPNTKVQASHAASSGSV